MRSARGRSDGEGDAARVDDPVEEAVLTTDDEAVSVLLEDELGLPEVVIATDAVELGPDEEVKEGVAPLEVLSVACGETVVAVVEEKDAMSEGL